MLLKRQLLFDYTLSERISNILRLLIRDRDVVILCIGSDRLTGDSLGPICGHYLKHFFNVPSYIYGCLDYPVHALNVTKTHNYINTRHKKSLVIAIDSMIGDYKNIGKCKLIYGGIYPGSADGKVLPNCGDISLTAIVSNKPTTNALAPSIRLGLVNNLALTLAKTISDALKPKSTNANNTQYKQYHV